tara:strand:- start:224 stop:3907 length:3684 start_codon:yes stop_codon:yes gene_type:complete
MPTRAPIGIQTDQERLKQYNTSINTRNLELDIPKNISVVEEEPRVPSEPLGVPVETEDDSDWFTPTSSDVEDDSDWFTPLESNSTDTDDSDWFTPIETGEFTTTEGGLIGLPVGVEAFSYSEDDLSTRDELYNPIFDFVQDRFGQQATYKKTKEEVVNTFLNSRRGVSSGNTLRGVAEVDYLMDVKDEPDRLMKAGKAYAIFENMESLTGDGVTWSEFGEGIKDYAASVVLDPVNLVGGLIGKAAGGATVKGSLAVAQKLAQKEISKILLAGGTKEAAKKAGNQVLREVTKQVAKEGTEEIAKFSANVVANKGMQKIFTRQGLVEIGSATAVDAVVSSGMEYLYQRSLVDTKVQGEVSKGAVGLAALSSMAMGGIQATSVLKRGTSNTALITETVVEAAPKTIAKEMEEAIKSFTNKPGANAEWLEKVSKGEELGNGDTDFFIDILLGINDADGNVQLKGLAQIMQEGGYYYTKRDDNDSMSNWVADFMKEKLDQDDINGIMKAFGGKKQLDISPEQFGDAFASKMNASARSMNSVMQVAKRLDVSVEDLDLDDFFEEALGLKLLDDIKFEKDKWFEKGPVGSNVAEIQNKFIRSLVSHPATSALNVIGYGAAASLDVAADVTEALFKATRGTFKSVMKVAGSKAQEDGVKEVFIAKQLLLASRDRLIFAFDNDMTAAAYKSALLKNTGALDKLNRTLSGGVEIDKSLDQSLKLGGQGAKYQGMADNVLDAVQTATLVHAQDSVTKSQEYVNQMNKALRTKFGKGWKEFYKSPEAQKIMATREYKQLEIDAVRGTLENTFSKSYKNSTTLGELAGFMEDARNIPGLGFMLPFGKFFNNTIDFAVKNTLGLNVFLKYAGGKYADKSYENLVARGLVAGGLITAFSKDEEEARKLGLGLYDQVIDGNVVSQQYDYPISLFKAAARIKSYWDADEKVPEDISAQVIKDFLGGGLTRNVTDTTKDIIELVEDMMRGQLDSVGSEAAGVLGKIATQAVGGFTRSLEPVDSFIALGLGIDQSPKDVYQGNMYIGQALKYIDTTTNFLLGKGDAPVTMGTATGELKQQTTKNFGVRVQNLTNLQRMMNLLGKDQWTLNPNMARDKKRLIPEAINEYQAQVYQALEDWSAEKMADPSFRNAPTDFINESWDNKVEQIREIAMLGLSMDYTGPQSTLKAQYDLYKKHSIDNIREASEELGLSTEPGELTEAELLAIGHTIDNKDFMMRMDMDTSLY